MSEFPLLAWGCYNWAILGTSTEVPRLRGVYMPLYEFECLECGVEFEKLVQKASETAQVQCPACNSQKLEEKVSRFSSVSAAGSSSSADCAPSGG
jgi:putative FmdB family regulatory protein